MRIEKAQKEDIPRILQIIEEARSFQLSYGNKQWAGGYPSPALIENDIATGIGFKVIVDERTEGYLAVVDYDESYDAIEGKWLSDQSYIALHRIAFSDAIRGRGLFPLFIDEMKKEAEKREAKSIRIDTDRQNPIMQHLLVKLGFTKTGYILFEGDRKLAYEIAQIMH